MASCDIVKKSEIYDLYNWLGDNIYLESTGDWRESDVMIDELSEHCGHHGVTAMHVTHILREEI